MKTKNKVFVWRSHWEGRYDAPYGVPQVCPWCATIMQAEVLLNREYHAHEKTDCPFCGWESEYSAAYGDSSYSYSVLREFEINAPELLMKELGSHLRSRFSDIYTLTWRRFEETVADIFRSHGLIAKLTQQTRDGGADLILLGDDDNRQGISAIVECKKYARERKIGVNFVRSLVGAAIDWDVRTAYIVTSSDFSKDARSKAIDFKKRGYDVNLVGATDLLKMLEVYNQKLPSLDRMTEQARMAIIDCNKENKSS